MTNFRMHVFARKCFSARPYSLFLELKQMFHDPYKLSQPQFNLPILFDLWSRLTVAWGCRTLTWSLKKNGRKCCHLSTQHMLMPIAGILQNTFYRSFLSPATFTLPSLAHTKVVGAIHNHDFVPCTSLWEAFDLIGEVRVVDSGRFDVVFGAGFRSVLVVRNVRRIGWKSIWLWPPVLEKSNLSVFWPCALWGLHRQLGSMWMAAEPISWYDADQSTSPRVAINLLPSFLRSAQVRVFENVRTRSRFQLRQLYV